MMILSNLSVPLDLDMRGRRAYGNVRLRQMRPEVWVLAYLDTLHNG